MRLSYKLIAILASLLVMLPLANAQCTLPSGVLAYSNVSIQNKNTIDSNGLQMIIPVNTLSFKSYETGNLMNVEFTYWNSSGTCTLVDSILVGNSPVKSSTSNQPIGSASSSSVNTLYVIKFNPSIASFTTDTNVISMDFASTSTNLMNGNQVGECPTCTSQYGQYWNGNFVYDFSSDFYGNTLNTSQFSNNGLTLTVNNGITIQSSGGSQYLKAIYQTSGVNAPFVFDVYGNLYQSTTSGHSAPLTGTLQLGTNYAEESSMLWQTEDEVPVQDGTGGSGLTIPNAIIIQTLVVTSSKATVIINYSSYNSTKTGTYATGNPLVLMASNYGTFTQKPFIQWFAVRNYPSNNIMPVVTFSSVKSAYALNNGSIFGYAAPNSSTVLNAIVITASNSIVCSLVNVKLGVSSNGIVYPCTESTNNIYSVYGNASSGSNWQYNYALKQGSFTTYYPSTTSYNVVFVTPITVTGNYDVNWVRVRVTPPNATMPSAVLGTISHV